VVLAYGALLLLACSKPAQSVDWYKSHGAARTTMVDQCLINGEDSHDCNNAKQAEFELSGIPAKNGRAVR